MEISLKNFPNITSSPSSPSTTKKIQKILNKILFCLKSQKPEETLILIHDLEFLKASSELLLKLGHLFFKMNYFLQAESLYKRILPNLKGLLNADCLFGLGQSCYELKKLQDCHMYFSILSENYQVYPYLGLVRLKLAKIQIIFNDLQGAFKIIEKIIVSTSSSKTLIVEAMMLLATVKENQGIDSESLKICKKALEICKTFTTICSFCILSYEKHPKHIEKLCRLNLRHFEKNEEWSDLCFLRALALKQLGLFEQAVSNLKDLVLSFPQNYFYLEFLGIAYVRQKQFFMGLECFYRVRILKPYDFVNSNNLAFCFKSLGEKDEALRILSEMNPFENMVEYLRKLEVLTPRLKISSFPTNL